MSFNRNPLSDLPRPAAVAAVSLAGLSIAGLSIAGLSLAGLSLAGLFLAAPTAAQGLAGDGPAQVGVVAGWRGDDGRHVAAVQIDLSPGWKTYWRAPGDAGIPPQFDWAGSSNLHSVEVRWPVPTPFTTAGLTSVGYLGDVMLPLIVTPRDPGRPVDLRGRMDLGVCEEICVPVSATLSAALPTTPGLRHDARIRAALGDRPRTAAEAGAGGMDCRLDAARDGVRLTVSLTLPAQGGTEFAVLETADPAVWVSPAATSRAGDTLTATVELAPPRGVPLALDRSAVRLTVLDGDGGAVEVRGCD